MFSRANVCVGGYICVFAGVFVCVSLCVGVYVSLFEWEPERK